MRKKLLVDLLKQRNTILFKQIPPMRAKDRTGEVKTYSVDGTYDWANTITIDLRKRANPAVSYIHESLHKLYPDASETEIYRMQRNLWKRLTNFERWLVFRRLFSRQWEEEK